MSSINKLFSAIKFGVTIPWIGHSIVKVKTDLQRILYFFLEILLRNEQNV